MTIFIFSLFLLLNLLVLLFMLYTLFAFISGAPFLPTGRKNINLMLKMAKPQKNEVLVDLGSGDGRILHQAAKTGCRCIGIEINPALYWWSKIVTKLKRLKNVEIRRENLWDFDLTNVDVLTLFFISSKMDRLQEKIKKEMKPGSRVVSHSFQFPHWQYTEKNGKIYLYRVI